MYSSRIHPLIGFALHLIYIIKILYKITLYYINRNIGGFNIYLGLRYPSYKIYLVTFFKNV